MSDKESNPEVILDKSKFTKTQVYDAIKVSPKQVGKVIGICQGY